MPSIAEIRNMYPDAKDASDEEIIGWVAKRSNMSLPDAARYFDYDLSGGQTSKRFGASIDRYQAGLYGTGEALAGAVGLDSASNYLAKQRQRNEAQADISSGRAKELGAIESYKDVNSVGTGINYAVGLGVQSAPYLAEALTGGVIGRGVMGGTRLALEEATTAYRAAQASGDVVAAAKAKKAAEVAQKSLSLGSDAGVVAASYPSSVGDVLSNQREQSGTTDAASAFALGVPYAALNVVGLEGALGRGQLFRNPLNLLDNVSGVKGALARTATTGTTAAVKEGAQETSQEFINQAGRMAVDPTEQFFNEKSNERFKESFIGGATLGGLIGGGAGGWRRSESFVPGANTAANSQTGQTATNEIQQAFQQNPTITPVGTTPGFDMAAQMSGTAGRVDPLTGRSSLVGTQAGTTPEFDMAAQMGGTADRVNPLAGRSSLVDQTAAPITAPAVTGGTTDIAQAQAASQQQNQQVNQAQKEQAAREDAFSKIGAVYNPEGQGSLQIFGQTILGPQVNTFGTALASKVAALPDHAHEITNAIAQANTALATKEKPSPLVSFTYNGNNPVGSADKAMQALAKTTDKFQIGHVDSVQMAADNLNTLSVTAKGNQLEQINAIHEALTGKDTSGYTASQQTKGAKNGQTLQTTSGLGTVPIQSGTGEGSGANTGDVQPSGVQSLLTGSEPQGQTGQQTGQPSGEGIRTGTGVATDLSGSQQPGQVNEQAASGLGEGQVPNQPQQTATGAVGEQAVQNGPRTYSPTIGYYASDLSHISSERRIEIIRELFGKILASVKGATAETRTEILRLSLLEQFKEKDIADLVGMSEAAVQKQLERMGVKMDRKIGQYVVTDPAIALQMVTEAANFRSAEFPDGIGEGELAGLYATRSEYETNKSQTLAEELEAGEQEGDRSKLLAEEMNRGEGGEDRTMGTIAKAGGSQGAVDSEGKVILNRIAKLQVKVNANPADAKAAADLAKAWNTYSALQKERAAKGEKNVAYEEEEEVDLTGETTKVEAEAKPEVDVAEQTKRDKLVAEARTKRKADRKGLEVGNTVVNPKLGTGVIESFSGDGAETTVTVKFQNGLTKTLSVASAKLEKTNAVQVESTDEGNVRKPARSGKTVGEGNAKPEKPAKQTKQAKTEVAPEEVKTPEEQWNELRTLAPELPAYADLNKDQRIRFDDLANRGKANHAAVVNQIVTAPATEIATEKRQTISDVVAEEQTEPVVEEQTEPVAQEELTAEEIIEESPEAAEINPEQQTILEEPIAALPEAQIARLENHYGETRGTSEFFTKLQEDVTAYATKGAQAVAAAIRDIIKAIHAGVLATAMVFNPSLMTKHSEVVVVAPRTVSQVREVKAEVPAVAKANMSKAAQEAYSTIYPSIAAKLKAENKFFVLTDKPNARVFIFNPDGSLFLQKKVLIGKTVGDYYKGNTDKVENRITPAGLFTMGLRDAKRGGGEAQTAGGYDFGKVFVLDKAIDGEYSVTLFHSVWTKEKDAQQRLAALQKEGAADSRYSFGCINVDKATYGSLVANNLQQMDGAALFIVPDKQELVGEFLTGATAQNKANKDELTRTPFTPKTETVTTTTPAQKGGQATTSKVSVVGREEDVTVGKMNAMRTFDVKDLDGTLTHMQETDLDRLERYSGVSRAIDKYRNDGMENVLDAVDGWYTTNDNVDWDGSFTALNGKPSIIVRTASLTNDVDAEWTTHHELGHAVDQAHLDGGGLFSGMSLFNVAVANNKIKPMGAIMMELHDHYENNPDSYLAKTLAYPFDRTKHGNLDANGVREEVFAQLWATYNTAEGNQFLEEELPNVYDLMELIHDEVRKTNYAETGNSQAAQAQAVGQTAYRGNQPRQVPGSANPVPFRAIRRQTVDETINRLPPFVRTPTRNLVTNLLHQAKNAVYASAITEDVVKLASKYMKSANDYLNAQYARQATRIEFEQRINSILSDFDKLSGEYKGTGANSVNKFIKDSTVSGKWGYYPGEHRVGTELFTVDPDMKLRFDAFGKDSDAQKVIKAVFEHGYEALMLKKKAVEAAIDREFADREKAVMGDAEQMKELAAEKKLLLAREAKVRGVDVSSPYAYLGRYGDHVVVAKSAEFKHYEERAKLGDWDVEQAKQWLQDNISNSDHYVVQFAETQAEADNIAEKLHATGKYDIMPEDAGVKEAEESYTGGGDIHLAVGRLRNLLQRQVSDGDMSSVNFHSMNKMVGDLYLMTVAEASARKSEMQRKNVSGADDNMMRNLATSGRADAHFLSSLEHNDAITDSMERMRNEARNHRREAMPIYNELIKRQANSMEYKSPGPLSVALTRMNTLWSLTFSPAFYLQQITQTAVISVPYLAGRIGYGNAVSQVNRGYKEIAGLIKGLGINEHIDFSKAPADVRDMLNKLVGMGKIDISMDSAERATADEKGVFAKVMYKMQGVNNRIESVNRSVAAIAAYRGYLEKYGNNNTEAATQYAAQVVSDTHGSYDGFNTPRALSNGIGRVVGQFRRFQIIQLSMLARLMHNSFKGASTEEKMVARKALGFIVAQMSVLGGAMAVPFMSQIAWMMSKILGDPDEPDDYEFKLRRMINNKVVSDLLLRGVPAALGVDVSDKLGMGRVASILPFAQGDLTSRSGAEKIIVAAMGPSASMGMKFADAFGMLLHGDYYKGLEMAMPNGFANVMKAGRFATEGITMRNGDLVLKPEDFGMVDAAFQAVGLPTNTVTDRQFTQNVKAEYDKFYHQKSTDIKGEYVNAYRAGDAQGMAKAREEFQRMEESRVSNGYKRLPMSELLKAPMAAMKRERGVIGGVETTKQNRGFVQLASQI